MPGASKTRLLAAFLVCCLTLGLDSHLTRLPQEVAEAQIAAATLMSACETAIFELGRELDLPFVPAEDPNSTGLIGPEYTAFTTTLGNLQAKRTSTDPAFAALMVRYFHELDLQPGQIVAIGASGSFPGLLLASLCAAKVMELEAAIIYSLGASMYGAGEYQLTGIEMLDHWRASGLLPYAVLAFSMGGGGDLANDLIFPEAWDFFLQKGQEAEIPFIYQDSLAQSEQERLRHYEAFTEARAMGGTAPKIACFVNIGGASVNAGSTAQLTSLHNGIVLPAANPMPQNEPGLVAHYLRQNTPVIHLLNIRELALKNGIPIDSSPFSAIGSGRVYQRESNLPARAILLGLGLLLASCLCLPAKFFCGFGRKKLPDGQRLHS